MKLHLPIIGIVGGLLVACAIVFLPGCGEEKTSTSTSKLHDVQIKNVSDRPIEYAVCFPNESGMPCVLSDKEVLWRVLGLNQKVDLKNPYDAIEIRVRSNLNFSSTRRIFRHPERFVWHISSDDLR